MLDIKIANIGEDISEAKRVFSLNDICILRHVGIVFTGQMVACKDGDLSFSVWHNRQYSRMNFVDLSIIVMKEKAKQLGYIVDYDIQEKAEANKKEVIYSRLLGYLEGLIVGLEDIGDNESFVLYINESFCPLYCKRFDSWDAAIQDVNKNSVCIDIGIRAALVFSNGKGFISDYCKQ